MIFFEQISYLRNKKELIMDQIFEVLRQHGLSHCYSDDPDIVFQCLEQAIDEACDQLKIAKSLLKYLVGDLTDEEIDTLIYQQEVPEEEDNEEEL